MAPRGLVLVATDLLTGDVKGTPSKPLPLRLVEQPQIVVPLSDARTGQVQVSMYERIASVLTAGDTALKVFYYNPKGTKVFAINGIVLQPTSDFDAGTITATLIDPLERLKHRYLHYNDVAIDMSSGVTVDAPSGGGDPGINAFAGGSFNAVNAFLGVPLDGRGLRVLVYDAAKDTKLRGTSIPFGIRTGTDGSTPQPDYLTAGPRAQVPTGVRGFTAAALASNDTLTSVDFSSGTPAGFDISRVVANMRIDGPGIPPYTYVVSASGTSIVMSKPATATITSTAFTLEDAIYCQLTRGDCVYDDIIDMVKAAGAFELDVIPIDAENLGFSGDAFVPGQMCELNTQDRIGLDRSQSQTDRVPVVFVHGLYGCRITHSPDADQLVTQDTEVGPGGPNGVGDELNIVSLRSGLAATYGIYEDFNQAVSAGTGDTPISNALLRTRAKATLIGYQRPPDFITITLDSDAQFPLCWGNDFFLGDTVTVVARKGYKQFIGDVRITQIGVTQVDEQGNCQLQIEAVPHLTSIAEEDGGITPIPVPTPPPIPGDPGGPLMPFLSSIPVGALRLSVDFTKPLDTSIWANPGWTGGDLNGVPLDPSLVTNDSSGTSLALNSSEDTGAAISTNPLLVTPGMSFGAGTVVEWFGILPSANWHSLWSTWYTGNYPEEDSEELLGGGVWTNFHPWLGGVLQPGSVNVGPASSAFLDTPVYVLTRFRTDGTVDVWLSNPATGLTVQTMNAQPLTNVAPGWQDYLIANIGVGQSNPTDHTKKLTLYHVRVWNTP